MANWASGFDKRSNTRRSQANRPDRSHLLVLPGQNTGWFSRSPTANFYTIFWGECSPTKMDYRKKGTLILTSLLEDLVPVTKETTINHPSRTRRNIAKG